MTRWGGALLALAWVGGLLLAFTLTPERLREAGVPLPVPTPTVTVCPVGWASVCGECLRWCPRYQRLAALGGVSGLGYTRRIGMAGYYGPDHSLAEPTCVSALSGVLAETLWNGEASGGGLAIFAGDAQRVEYACGVRACWTQ